MMEHVYAFGVICIEFVQKTFEGWDDFFYQVNSLADPHYGLNLVFPFVSAFDSVFAAQFLLAMAFGEWFNAITKWLIGEHRPYWWVQETSYYGEQARPALLQHAQTCETGPGSPSGHSMAIAMELLLLIMWIEHVLHDRKMAARWWGRLAWGLFSVGLPAVMLARVYIAAHFPHQCVMGAACGIFLAPALCLYVNDPYVWQLGGRGAWGGWGGRRGWHVAAALACVALSFLVYWSLKAAGIDPQWSVMLAFRWCRNPDNINVTTTPLFSLVEACGSLLGYAIFVTPTIARYRHYTKMRVLWLAVPVTILCQYLLSELQAAIPTDNATVFYLAVFAFYALKPILFLRIIPFLAMVPCAKLERRHEAGTRPSGDAAVKKTS